MSYLDHFHALKSDPPDHFLPFVVEDTRVGAVLHGFAEHLASWPEVFEVGPRQVRLNPLLQDFAARSEALHRVTRGLYEQGVIHRWHGERYALRSGFHQPPLALLDRASAAYFGIRAYGQHLNGYVRDSDGIKMWVARRSRHKPSFPSKLDHLVAGGLPYGIACADNLAKECWEEATLPEDLARQALPVGAVTYCVETEHGLKPDTLFNYDLELPADFRPRSNDDEVEDFYLWPIEQVMEAVRDSQEFKPNCALVIVDFLIRHGLLGPEHPDYEQLVVLRTSGMDVYK